VPVDCSGVAEVCWARATALLSQARSRGGFGGTWWCANKSRARRSGRQGCVGRAGWRAPNPAPHPHSSPVGGGQAGEGLCLPAPRSSPQAIPGGVERRWARIRWVSAGGERSGAAREGDSASAEHSRASRLLLLQLGSLRVVTPSSSGPDPRFLPACAARWQAAGCQPAGSLRCEPTDLCPPLPAEDLPLAISIWKPCCWKVCRGPFPFQTVVQSQ